MFSETMMVLTHCPSEEIAERIAAALVENRLAACVNQLAPARSTYRWQGKVERETEVPLLIKTTRVRYPDVEAAIRALHPYSVPEIIALPIVVGYAPYLRWIDESTASGDTLMA
jgi:periplasmic divalent cation tolerance protein